MFHVFMSVVMKQKIEEDFQKQQFKHSFNIQTVIAINVMVIVIVI